MSEWYVAFASSNTASSASEFRQDPAEAVREACLGAGWPWVHGRCLLQTLEIEDGQPVALWYEVLSRSSFEYYGMMSEEDGDGE